METAYMDGSGDLSLVLFFFLEEKPLADALRVVWALHRMANLQYHKEG